MATTKSRATVPPNVQLDLTWHRMAASCKFNLTTLPDVEQAVVLEKLRNRFQEVIASVIPPDKSFLPGSVTVSIRRDDGISVGRLEHVARLRLWAARADLYTAQGRDWQAAHTLDADDYRTDAARFEAMTDGEYYAAVREECSTNGHLIAAYVSEFNEQDPE